jgi:hypothetical protein
VVYLISILGLCNWYGSEDVASNTIILSNLHLLELVSIPSRYPFENDEPVYNTQQSDEESDDDVRLRIISVMLQREYWHNLHSMEDVHMARNQRMEVSSGSRLERH